MTVNTNDWEALDVPSLPVTVIVVAPTVKGATMFNVRDPAGASALSKVIPLAAAITVVLDDMYDKAMLPRFPMVVNAMSLKAVATVAS